MHAHCVLIHCGAMDCQLRVPQVETGDYFQTKWWGRSRCKAYTAPPSTAGGRYICTLAQGTFLGPVISYELNGRYLSIEVRGYWINVWDGWNQASFAHRVSRQEVESWEQMRWYHSQAQQSTRKGQKKWQLQKQSQYRRW